MPSQEFEGAVDRTRIDIIDLKDHKEAYVNHMVAEKRRNYLLCIWKRLK